ncbi:4893_t:CDS:2, partial [Gigaspora margarita]
MKKSEEKKKENEVYAVEENRYQPYIGGSKKIAQKHVELPEVERALNAMMEDKPTLLKGPGENVTHPWYKKTTQKQEEWDWKSQDTFDEFIYESEELDEKKGYLSIEVSEDELNLYDNPWKNEISLAIYLILVEELPTLDEEE